MAVSAARRNLPGSVKHFNSPFPPPQGSAQRCARWAVLLWVLLVGTSWADKDITLGWYPQEKSLLLQLPCITPDTRRPSKLCCHQRTCREPLLLLCPQQGAFFSLTSPITALLAERNHSRRYFFWPSDVFVLIFFSFQMDPVTPQPLQAALRVPLALLLVPHAILIAPHASFSPGCLGLDLPPRG